MIQLAQTYSQTTQEKISITSESGDESAYSFTIVGTDIAGNAQTEVILAQLRMQHFGTKTFKTVTSVTPSSNSTGSVLLELLE